MTVRLPDLPPSLSQAIADRVQEEGGCLIWLGYSNNKSPMVYWNRRYIPVRRLLYSAMFPERGDLSGLWVRSSCGTPRCVSPYHIEAVSEAEFMRALGRIGHDNPHVQLLRNSKISAARRDGAKLSDEVLREILESDDSSTELARRYGVSRTLIWRYRSGRSARVLRVKPNPWMQLGGQ